MTPGHNVRLTTQAHRLCAEKAKRCGTSMRAVASEAIFLFSANKEKDSYEDEKSHLASQQQQARWKLRQKMEAEQALETAKRRALLLLIVTAIATGCTGIIIGVML